MPERMTPERFAQLARLPADTRRGPERELWEALVAERDAAELAYAIADAASVAAIESESMKGIDGWWHLPEDRDELLDRDLEYAESRDLIERCGESVKVNGE